jgi:hypothetical protein
MSAPKCESELHQLPPECHVDANCESCELLPKYSSTFRQNVGKLNRRAQFVFTLFDPSAACPTISAA